MKAMVLASGTGSRLSPLTDTRPKCLVEISENKSILERQLDQFTISGISDVIITTGPYKEKIHAVIKEKFSNMRVTFVYNEKYASTNYIYSMHKCADLIDDDFILVHGDLVFENELLARILNEKASVVAINRTAPLPEKDFKGRVVRGRITEIGINIFGNNAFFLAPIYKLDLSDFLLWMNNIEKLVSQKRWNEYAENAFNEISNAITLLPLFYDGLFCQEIDTLEDLRSVREYFRNFSEV